MKNRWDYKTVPKLYQTLMIFDDLKIKKPELNSGKH